MTDPGRPQDQGRKHRRKGRPGAETTQLLADVQAAARAEIRALLAELSPEPPAPGLVPLAKGEPAPAPVRPPIAKRGQAWDLITKLARYLGDEIDDTPEDPGVGVDRQGGTTPPARRRKVDYG